MHELTVYDNTTQVPHYNIKSKQQRKGMKKYLRNRTINVMNKRIFFNTQAAVSITQ